MPFITLEEMDMMAEKIEAELGIGKVRESEGSRARTPGSFSKFQKRNVRILTIYRHLVTWI